MPVRQINKERPNHKSRRGLLEKKMRIEKPLSATFKQFTHSGKAGAVLLILCTLASLVIANSKRVLASQWPPTSPSRSVC